MMIGTVSVVGAACCASDRNGMSDTSVQSNSWKSMAVVVLMGFVGLCEINTIQFSVCDQSHVMKKAPEN